MDSSDLSSCGVTPRQITPQQVKQLALNPPLNPTRCYWAARRKFFSLFALIFVVSLLFGSAVFGAKASKATTTTTNHDQLQNQVLDKARFGVPLGGDYDPMPEATGGKPSGAFTSMGFQAVNGIVDLGRTTSFDLGSNQSQPRQIVLGCSGRLHAVFMEISVANPTRLIAGASFVPGGPITTGELSATGSGFPSLTTNGTGLALAAYHHVAAGGTLAGVDIGCGAMAMSTSGPYPDSLPTGQGSGTDENNSNYIWPQVAYDLKCSSGNWYVHMIAHESPTTFDVTGHQSLVYWRSQDNSHQPLGTIATFIDSIGTISGTVVVAPDQCDERVAIIYSKPRDYTNPENIVFLNDNPVYRESSDGGATWGPVMTIYHYQAEQNSVSSEGKPFFERNAENSGIYSSDGCLHVLFSSVWTDTGWLFEGNGGYYLRRPRAVYHWDECSDQVTLVNQRRASAIGPCGPGAGGLHGNIAKINIAECNNRLYAIYSQNLSTSAGSADTAWGPVFSDCSDGATVAEKFQNYDIFARVSSTWGATWGPDSNLTSTATDNCSPNSCRSELHLGSVERSTDSLRIFFLEDRDAGVSLNSAGIATNSPLKVLTRNCFNMQIFTDLRASVASIGYPLNVPPGTFKDTTIVVTNLGNVNTNFTVGQTGGFLSFPSGTNFIVPAGASNTVDFVVRITAPAGPDSYAAGSITITYTNPEKAEQAVIIIPVERYSFVTFHLPQDTPLRTFYNRLNTNQASQVSNNIPGRMFSYFADTSDYLYEGHLIIGNDALNLSYSVFDEVGVPTVTNPYGYTYAATAGMPIDSTTFATYRIAQGKGVNRDSTIGFDVKWYASKLPDTADGYVGIFNVYKGPKNPTGTVGNLSLAYYTDWDIPSDSGSDNTCGFDASRAMVWQRGAYGPPNDTRYGATAAYRNDGNNVVGGWVLDNPTYIYPDNGYDNDSIWAIMEGLSQGQYRLYSGAPEDVSGGILIYRDASINGANSDTLKFGVILAGTRNGGINGLNTAVDKLQRFLCGLNLLQGADICELCKCGDADGNGIFTISDAVYLINYIFGGGPSPNPLCLGDADGNTIITISDAVYLINYIFAGGAAPSCEGGGGGCVPVSSNENYRVRYESVFPANQSQFDVSVFFDCDWNYQTVSLPLRIRVDGQVPTIVEHQFIPLPNSSVYGSYLTSTGDAVVSFVSLTLTTGAPTCQQIGRVRLAMSPQPVARSISMSFPDDPQATVFHDNWQCYFPVLYGSPTPECGGGSLCQNSFTDPTLTICPGGDAVFKVYLRDPLNQPIVGDSSVYIQFTGNCGGINRCPPGGAWPTLYPINSSDANGELRFYPLAGGGCNQACYADIKAPCGTIATVPVRTFDITGDFGVSMSQDFNYSECNNYNGQSGIQFADQNAFYAHVGHSCGLDPCERFTSQFTLNPSTNLSPGQQVELTLVLSNNNFESCFIGFIGFFASGFGTGTQSSLIANYNYGQTIPAGGADTVVVPYTVPGEGHGCLSVQFNSSCCATITMLEECAQSTWHCVRDGSVCYEFFIALNGQTVHNIVIPNDYLATGWYYVPVHVPVTFPLTPPDSVVYRICTPEVGNIGDDARVPVEVWYDQAGVNVEIFESQVFVTPRTGDADGNCLVSISDAVYLINYIFAGGLSPLPCQAGDVDCTGIVNISDAVSIINYIFAGGPPPCIPGEGTPAPTCLK